MMSMSMWGSSLRLRTLRSKPSSAETSSAHHSCLSLRRLVVAFLFVIANLWHWNNNVLILSTSSSGATRTSTDTTVPSSPLATVAYAISITSCTSKLSSTLFDAASVLRQSILLNSWPLHPSSRYGAAFYAFTISMTTTTTTQDECSRILSLAGWTVLPQSRPVHPELIKEPEGSILKMGIGR